MARDAPRFVVAETHGYRTARRGWNAPPGVTAHVLDRLDIYRVVASFQSESPDGWGGKALGVEGARARARAAAFRLNAEHS